MRWMGFIMLFMLAGCAAAKEPGQVTLDFQVRNAAGDRIQTAAPGETVHFVFRIANETDTSVGFRYTFPPHRVTVRGPFGNTLWEAHAGMAFIQMMRDERLAAGAAREFGAEWQVPAGVSGKLRVEPSFHAFVNGRVLEGGWETASLEIREPR